MRGISSIFVCLVFILLTGTTAHSEIITRMVHGKPMTLEKITSPQGGIDYRLTSEQTIPLAFGNQITLEDAELDFHLDSDQIALLTVYQPSTVQWKLPTGESFALNCGLHFVNQRARIISLHKNGQIHIGCAVGGNALLPTIAGDLIEVSSLSGSIDFTEDGYIKYVSKADSVSFRVHNQEVKLATNREIAYHKNGLPHFFTIAQGETLHYSSSRFGELQLSSPPSRLLSTLFGESGQLVASYIKNTFDINSSFFSTLKAGAGPVAFFEDSEIPLQASLTLPQLVTIGPQDISVELQGRVEFYENQKDYRIRLARLSGPQMLKFKNRDFSVVGSIGFFEEGQELQGFITTSVVSVIINNNEQILVSGPMGFFPNGEYRSLQIENETVRIKLKRGDALIDINAEKGDQIFLNEDGFVIRLIPHQIIGGPRAS